MINMIIVDDEILSIKALENCIDWSEMGVDRIFTANSAKTAKEIFENNRIDIMLCDIEMPQENGLELLAWVKANYPETEAIIQSCHANFKYAQKALQLESIDYILKPVLADDLKIAVNKAIKKIESNRKDSSQAEEEKYRIIYPLPDILKQPDNIDILFLQKLVENQVDISGNNRVLPIVTIIRQSNENSVINESEIIKILINDIGKICDSKQVNLVKLDNKVFLFLLLNPLSEENIENIQRVFDLAFKRIYNNCGEKLMCCIGNTVLYAELMPVIMNLLLLGRTNISNVSNTVFRLDSGNHKERKFPTLDTTHWAILLEAGSTDKLLKEVKLFFDNISDELKNDTSYLAEIRKDFIQMLFSVLNRKGIQAHQLFCNNTFNKLFDRAQYTVHEMIAWIEHIVTYSINMGRALSKEQSIIEKSTRYIKLHLDQNIKREDVANYVYLNPDYLTRIFKKETGMSITEYIIQERIKIAKTLLENTDMPVSSIALRVGYTNFSHFAKTFRKHVGMNPADYKNSLKNEEPVPVNN
jgi:two-component system response regulator YesN